MYIYNFNIIQLAVEYYLSVIIVNILANILQNMAKTDNILAYGRKSIRICNLLRKAIRNY